MMCFQSDGLVFYAAFAAILARIIVSVQNRFTAVLMTVVRTSLILYAGYIRIHHLLCVE